MDRFAIVGFRSVGRNLLVDVSHRNSVREVRALTLVLDALSGETGVKHSGFGSEDSQRYAFATLLSQLLRFSDEGNFAKELPEKDRQKRLRALAASVNRQLGDIVEGHRHRRITTVTWRNPDAPDVLLKTIRKALAALG